MENESPSTPTPTPTVPDQKCGDHGSVLCSQNGVNPTVPVTSRDGDAAGETQLTPGGSSSAGGDRAPKMVRETTGRHPTTDESVDPLPFLPCASEDCDCDPELPGLIPTIPNTVILCPDRLLEEVSTNHRGTSVIGSNASLNAESTPRGRKETDRRDQGSVQDDEGGQTGTPDRMSPAELHSSDEDKPERVVYLLSATRIPARHQKLVHAKIHGRLEAQILLFTPICSQSDLSIVDAAIEGGDDICTMLLVTNSGTSSVFLPAGAELGTVSPAEEVTTQDSTENSWLAPMWVWCLI